MRTGPWELREGTSREVLVAVYLRDALGVVDVSGLPRLRGTALPAVEPPGEEITWWWMRWWISIVDPGARDWGAPLQALDDDALVVLPADGAEAYQRAVRRHLDDARAFAEVAQLQAEQDRPRDTTFADLVAEREHALGRPARPFRVRLEVLPLTAAGIWWVGETMVAVDAELRADLSSYRLALEPIVAQLV